MRCSEPLTPLVWFPSLTPPLSEIDFGWIGEEDASCDCTVLRSSTSDNGFEADGEDTAGNEWDADKSVDDVWVK